MATIHALIPGHYLTTSSGPLGAYAECECGQELTWATFEQDHTRHVLALVWDQGFRVGDTWGSRMDRHLNHEGAESGEPHECKRCPTYTNPWKEEQ